MKRVLIASLFSLAAAPVFATTSSFNDFPEQGKLEAAPDGGSFDPAVVQRPTRPGSSQGERHRRPGRSRCDGHRPARLRVLDPVLSFA